MSLSKNRIRFTLKARSESFFLLLASPEGGIWSADDLMRTGDFDPTRFSGPYSVSGKNSNGMELKQNPNSPTIARFPAAPKTITLQNATSEDVPGMFQNGKTDVFFEPERPYYSDDFKKLEANRQLSSYNTMFYLYRVGSSTGELGADYFSALWSTDNAQSSIPAASFLPFGSLGILNRESYLNALRPRSSKVVRVAAPQNYFHDKFLAELIGAGKKVDIDLKIEKVPYAQWGAMIGPATSEKFEFDFLLAPYVASERFPSVQINFLLEGRVPPFELRHLDEPSSSLERRTEIENLEKWMISSQTVLPLVFVRNHLISARGINVGDQPITDAEVQLWRVNTN